MADTFQTSKELTRSIPFHGSSLLGRVRLPSSGREARTAVFGRKMPGCPACRDDGRAVPDHCHFLHESASVERHPCRPPFGSGFGPKPAAGAFKAAGAPRSGHPHQPRQTSPAGRCEVKGPCLPAKLVRSALVRTDPEASSFRRFFWTAPEGRAGRGRLGPSERP